MPSQKLTERLTPLNCGWRRFSVHVLCDVRSGGCTVARRHLWQSVCTIILTSAPAPQMRNRVRKMTISPQNNTSIATKIIWIVSTVYIYEISLAILNFNQLMHDKTSLSRSNWPWSGLFDVIKAKVYTCSFKLTLIVFSCSFYGHQDCLNPPRLALDGHFEGEFSSRDRSPWTMTIQKTYISTHQLPSTDELRQFTVELECFLCFWSIL